MTVIGNEKIRRQTGIDPSFVHLPTFWSLLERRRLGGSHPSGPPHPAVLRWTLSAKSAAFASAAHAGGHPVGIRSAPGACKERRRDSM